MTKGFPKKKTTFEKKDFFEHKLIMNSSEDNQYDDSEDNQDKDNSKKRSKVNLRSTFIKSEKNIKKYFTKRSWL